MVPIEAIGQTGNLRSIMQTSVTSTVSVTDSCRMSFSVTWQMIRKKKKKKYSMMVGFTDVG